MNTILVDDKCTFCNKTVLFIINHGGENKFNFISLYSDEGKRLLKKHGYSTDYNESVILITKNNTFVKSGAVLRIFRQLNGLFPLLYSFIVVPGTIRDWVYDFVSKHRHRF